MIKMGNDEFILYIRKNGRGVGVQNPVLGKRIWEWLDNQKRGATIGEPDKDCHWGNTGVAIGEFNLPKTATQFEFDESMLPALYRFLNTL